MDEFRRERKTFVLVGIAIAIVWIILIPLLLV
jgi:hypothetical protein